MAWCAGRLWFAWCGRFGCYDGFKGLYTCTALKNLLYTCTELKNLLVCLVLFLSSTAWRLLYRKAVVCLVWLDCRLCSRCGRSMRGSMACAVKISLD
jgi:hypothetical protein